MDSKTTLDRFLGSVIGAAVGDAIGAPMEFWPADRYDRVYGGDWVDDMVDFREMNKAHPHGVWRPNPPKGTATDDTRYNLLFIEAVLKYGVGIRAPYLATEFVDRYIRRDEHYPGYHDLATDQFAFLYVHACTELGIECPLRPGVPPYVLRGQGSTGNGWPTAMGLISMPAAGLLHPGDGETTYKHAFELDFLDIGYARDALAILATMIGLAFDESLSPREVIRKAMEIDPYDLRGVFLPRAMGSWVNRCLDIADEAKDERELVVRLSREVAHDPGFTAKDLLGFPVAAAYYAEGDPRSAITIAVNARDVDEAGNLVGFRDIDCTASVCGALVGAMSGLSKFPQDWVEACVGANREVYGFDIEASARDLHTVVMASMTPNQESL